MFNHNLKKIKTDTLSVKFCLQDYKSDFHFAVFTFISLKFGIFDFCLKCIELGVGKKEGKGRRWKLKGPNGFLLDFEGNVHLILELSCICYYYVYVYMNYIYAHILGEGKNNI